MLSERSNRQVQENLLEGSQLSILAKSRNIDIRFVAIGIGREIDNPNLLKLADNVEGNKLLIDNFEV